MGTVLIYQSTDRSIILPVTESWNLPGWILMILNRDMGSVVKRVERHLAFSNISRGVRGWEIYLKIRIIGSFDRTCLRTRFKRPPRKTSPKNLCPGGLIISYQIWTKFQPETNKGDFEAYNMLKCIYMHESIIKVTEYNRLKSNWIARQLS